MFGQLMSGIDDDYVQVRHARPGPGARAGQRRRAADLARAQYPAADDPVQGSERHRSGPWPPARRRARRSCSPAEAGPATARPGAADAGRGRGDPGARSCKDSAVRPGRPQRPLPVRERQEVQVLPRALGRCSGRARLHRRPARPAPAARRGRAATCDLDGSRERAGRARGRGGPPRPVGRPRRRPAGHPRVRPGQRRRRRCSTALDGPAVATPRPCTSWRVEEGDDSRRRPSSRPRSPAWRADLEPARAAVAVHRRARRARRGLRDPRRGRRHRRPGLGRDDAAHVPALGRAARLRGRGRRGQPRARRPGSCRPRFIVKGRYAYGLLAVRARRAPAGAHLAVRLPGPPPDQLRRR